MHEEDPFTETSDELCEHGLIESECQDCEDEVREELERLWQEEQEMRRYSELRREYTK